MTPTTTSRPVCDWSTLHVDECAHCQQGGTPAVVVTIGTIEHATRRPQPAYRHRDPRWKEPDPHPTLCEHRKEDLCPTCDTLLEGLLQDLPELLHQLGIAMRKDTRFAPHGHRQGDLETPDEAPIPWNPAAASCLSDLTRLIRSTWPDRKALLVQLSTLASRAHRIIDRPKDRAYSMCPQCRHQIEIEDRTLISCPDCHYHATWEQHQTDLLDANGDMMLTAEEIRFVLARNGEPITRQRISYLVERHGLPREQVTVPSWQGRRIVTEARYVYRLSDVRALQERLAS